MSTIIPFIAAPGYRFTTRWVEVLQQTLPECTVVPVEFLSTEQRALVQVAVVANPDPQTLRLLPNLKWVHSVWAGVERLLSDLQDWQLPVVRLKDPELARTMAEAVLAWTMYLHRDMPAYRQLQTERRWQPLDYIPARARRISVLGAGALGGTAMKLLQQIMRQLKHIFATDASAQKQSQQFGVVEHMRALSQQFLAWHHGFG